ncbi:MAG: glycosyltransferase family 2 protein [Clostridia bacterium]|nr:glycosyltransferase family 2 protein [Clostridia bacterium]
MDKKITGCIVTYNNIATIDNALGSLLKCTEVPFTLYVVDNGSTDGTVEHIEKNYPEVVLVKSGGNIGFGAGHNYILDRLDSDYHAIINPDIIVRDDVIAKLAEFLNNNGDIGMASPEIRFPDGRIQILGKLNPNPVYLVASRLRGNKPGKILRKYAMLDRDLSVPTDIENATGCFMFIRTKLFKEIGGFDKRYFMYFEDGDLTREVNQRSRVVYYPGATVYHEWGRESKKNFKLKLIQIQSMMNYFKKWGLK